MIYHVTGVTVRGERFKIVTSNYIHAMGINLWRGSVWEVKDGRRKRIKHVVN